MTQLLRLDNYVDMIIPRGGAALHKLCREQATIPVITGGIGVCHLFVDASADQPRSLDIIENAKCSAPASATRGHGAGASRCGRRVSTQLAARMGQCKVELRATGAALRPACRLTRTAPSSPAGPDDFDQEWMALILGVKVVEDVEAAIEHIYAHGSEHSDGILTNDLGER
jgi:glutamate-5-semialdehyde dehydrogenase